LYDLNHLTSDELERLFIHESHKFLSGIELGFSHNTIQSFKVNLDKINYELNQRQPRTRKSRLKNDYQS